MTVLWNDSSNKKTRLRPYPGYLWLSKLWGNTVIFYWLIKVATKFSKSLNTSALSQNSYRTLLPGSTYIAPPSNGVSQSFSQSRMRVLKSCKHRETTAKNLQSLFQGLGRDTANELERILVSEKLFHFSVTFSIKKPSHAWLRLPSVQFLLQIKWESLLPVFLILLDTYYGIRLSATTSNSKPVNSFAVLKMELQKIDISWKTGKRVTSNRQCGRISPKGELLTTFPPPSA